MTSFVISGHGSVDELYGGMDTCALAPGTTIQFYADLGQYLWWGAGSVVDFPDGIAKPWQPVDSKGVVPNFFLWAFTDAEIEELQTANLNWGGYEVLHVGRDIDPAEAVMCTGTPDICPTDPRMIAGTIAGPRQHDASCRGLLKLYAGHDLHWLPCTSVSAQDRVKQPLQIDPESRYANYLEGLQSDPLGFAAWFDTLDEEEIDDLLEEPQIYSWHVARMLMVARDGAPEHVALGDDPDDPVATALRFLDGGGDFGAYVDPLPQVEWDLLIQNERIAEWARQNGRL